MCTLGQKKKTGRRFSTGLLQWLSGKECTCSAGDIGNTASIPGLGRPPGGRNGNPLQCSHLKNPMDREAWRAAVHEVTKSQMQLSMYIQRFSSSVVPNLYGTAAAATKSLQSCPTLCDPIDGSPPGSLVPGILQARTLEWVAISFSNA